MPSEKIAVCIVPGAGDTKLFFKWQLVKALLAHGITVLIIDPPGHGDYRHRPLVYPDCLTAVPAAIAFLRKQPNIKRVGLLGISLGGAMAIRAAAEAGSAFVDALGVVATPTHLNYSQRLFYKEIWRTFYRSPVVPLLQEVTARQARAMWRSGGYRGQHTTAEMFDLLDPLGHIGQVAPTPLLLVYSQRDAVASPLHAEALYQAAPHARLIETKKASHVMLTLTPEINMQIAGWFHTCLSK
jgi:pimeloyl-ACP methyl ester carboxylesterase